MQLCLADVIFLISTVKRRIRRQTTVGASNERNFAGIWGTIAASSGICSLDYGIEREGISPFFESHNFTLGAQGGAIPWSTVKNGFRSLCFFLASNQQSERRCSFSHQRAKDRLVARAASTPFSRMNYGATRSGRLA